MYRYVYIVTGKFLHLKARGIDEKVRTNAMRSIINTDVYLFADVVTSVTHNNMIL